MPKITPDIAEKAYQIYKALPDNIKKGEWVSDAIIEKYNREHGISLEDRVKTLEQRVVELEKKVGE